MRSAIASASSAERAVPFSGWQQAKLLQQHLEPLAVLGDVDGVGTGAEDRECRRASSACDSFSGVCPPYCTMQPSTLPRDCSRRTSAITSSAVSGSKYSRSEVS